MEHDWTNKNNLTTIVTMSFLLNNADISRMIESIKRKTPMFVIVHGIRYEIYQYQTFDVDMQRQSQLVKVNLIYANN